MNSLQNFHRGETGSVMLSSVFLVIGMAFLIGYVGNMWSEVIEKQNAQAAADAGAYSSAVWQARSMNTVCTCNHLMGELTALVVLLEALGGPEAGEPFAPTATDRELNSTIKSVKEMSKSKSIIAAFRPFDAKLVDILEYYAVSGHTKHSCGAAIYDAELTLKTRLAVGLLGKRMATQVEIVGPLVPVIGSLISLVGTAVHGYIDIPLGTQVLPELLKLRMLEMVVAAVAPTVKGTVRMTVPMLGIYSAEIAGIGATEGATYVAIRDTMDRLRDFHALESCVGAPLHLPVVREEGPTKGKSNRKPIQTPWTSRDDDVWQITHFNIMTDMIIGMGYAEQIAAFPSYLDARLTPRWRRSSRKRKLIREYPKIGQYLGQIRKSIPRDGYDENPSRQKLKSFDMDAEKVSQFVRATYPHVDSIRSPMRGWFKDEMPLSNISTYFTLWSYRYTLNESYCMRSGEDGRLAATMLVLEGFEPKKKGHEVWTDSPDDADRMFSVVVAVLGPSREPIFSPKVFPRARSIGDVAMAQGMIYNLNRRDPDADSSGTARQPTTGWDTLQWEPSGDIVRAPEWNAQPSGPKGELPPWLFFSGRSLAWNDGARVKLNWQAKLRPATAAGAKKLAENPDADPAVKAVCDVLAEHADLLIH